MVNSVNPFSSLYASGVYVKDEAIGVQPLNYKWNKNVDSFQKEEILNSLLCDAANFADEVVIEFLKNKNISPNDNFFSNSFNQPTALKETFLTNRPNIFEQFFHSEQNDEAVSSDIKMVEEEIPQTNCLLKELSAQWQVNSAAFTKSSWQANFNILKNAFENAAISEPQLTDFLGSIGFRWNGGWFDRTGLDEIVLKNRPGLFESKRQPEKLSKWTNNWEVNRDRQNFDANAKLLLSIIVDKTISDRSFVEDYLKPQNISWTGNFIKSVQSYLLECRPDVYNQYVRHL